MDIAPGVKSSRWKELNLDLPDSPDWGEAIDIFKARIWARYIMPVDILIEKDKEVERGKRKFGFTILAIDSLLMETLQAFRQGICDTKSGSRELITNFLKKAHDFKWETKHAHFYYDDIRCGILHRAEIGGHSLVRSEDNHVFDKDGLIINRTKLHNDIKQYVEYYIGELKINKMSYNDRSIGSCKVNYELRKNFRTKMDYICRDNLLSEKYPIR